MPITQNRMMELIGAAKSFERYAKEVKAIVKEEYKNLLNKTFTGEDALTTLYATLESIHIDNEAVEVLAREDEHFRVLAHRNNRAARKMKAKRLGLLKKTRRTDVDLRKLPEEERNKVEKEQIENEEAMEKVADTDTGEETGEDTSEFNNLPAEPPVWPTEKLAETGKDWDREQREKEREEERRLAAAQAIPSPDPTKVTHIPGSRAKFDPDDLPMNVFGIPLGQTKKQDTTGTGEANDTSEDKS